MKTLLKAIVLVVIAVLLIAFSVANREVVTVSLDPFSSGAPAYVLSAPMYLIVLLLLSIGVVIGGVASWPSQLRAGWAARRARAEAAGAQAENGKLRTELDIQSRQGREAARLAAARPVPALGMRDAH